MISNNFICLTCTYRLIKIINISFNYTKFILNQFKSIYIKLKIRYLNYNRINTS